MIIQQKGLTLHCGSHKFLSLINYIVILQNETDKNYTLSAMTDFLILLSAK